MSDQSNKSFYRGDRKTISQSDSQRRENGGDGDFAAYAHKMHQKAKDSIASLSNQESINGINSILDNNDTLFKDALRSAISRKYPIENDLRTLYSLGDDHSDNTNEPDISKKREIKVREALSRLAESPQHSNETIEKALHFIRTDSTMRAFCQPTSSRNEGLTQAEPSSSHGTDNITQQEDQGRKMQMRVYSATKLWKNNDEHKHKLDELNSAESLDAKIAVLDKHQREYITHKGEDKRKIRLNQMRVNNAKIQWKNNDEHKYKLDELNSAESLDAKIAVLDKHQRKI